MDVRKGDRLYPLRLNALSGIGGVQTHLPHRPTSPKGGRVLMPCRALEAFRRPSPGITQASPGITRLNALSGIGGVQTGLLQTRAV